MKDAEDSRPVASLGDWFTGLGLSDAPAVRVWLQGGLLVLAVMVPTILAYAFDGRQLDGISVWAKPFKFQLAVALHLFTLALATTLLARRFREGLVLRITAWASTAAGIFEIAYIVAQAGRQRHSHFNEETAFEAAMYAAMGIGAVTLVVASGLVGVLIWRSPLTAGGPGLRLGSILGLLLGSAATLLIGGYLSNLGSHWIGGVASDANGLPLTGWSTTGGDLRVPHFLATHLMQGLPLIGLIADRFIGDGRRTVLLAAGLWAILVVAASAQALNGLPLLAL